MTYEITIGGVVRRVHIERSGEGWLVAIDQDPPRQVEGRRLGAVLHLLIEGRSHDAGLVRSEGGWDVDLRGTHHTCSVVDPRKSALRLSGGTANGTLTTSMPGRIVAVSVAVGDIVSTGDTVLVVEAMKMENEVHAPVDGVVAEVLVSPGDAVETGATLLRIE